MTDAPSSPLPPPKPKVGLSAKLLVLTVLFVMLTEVLVYVPSVANFRVNWLNDRLTAARTAALVLEVAPSGPAQEAIAREVLDSIRAKAVAVKLGHQRRMLASSANLPPTHHEIDMRDVTWWTAIVDAFDTLFSMEHDTVRVIGPAPIHGDFVEVVVDEGPLRDAMLRFSKNVLLLSLFISVVTAALVYIALLYLFVRPMRRLTAEMVAFRRNPEHAAPIAPTRRTDEIGIAERELAGMQTDIASMLHQKSRLAALGLAVSKINHDLRNMLSSAQLFSDRLTNIPDPNVQRFAPKLMRALERAIDLCQSTLSYGKAQEPAPERRLVLLEPLIEEVRDTLGLTSESAIGWVSAIERGTQVDADPDQLFRVLVNLARNAMQALETRAPNDPVRDQIRITGRREGAVTMIEIADTGPGVPDKAREHLFEAFQGSARAGGTGLGLAIAAELVRAHGGDIRLVDGTIGAAFRIAIPDRVMSLAERRVQRARA